MLGFPEGNGRRPRKKPSAATLVKLGASTFPSGPVLPRPSFPGAVLAVTQSRRARERCRLSETRGRAGPEAAQSWDP